MSATGSAIVRSIGKRAKKSLGYGRIQWERNGWTTHVGQDSSLGNTTHGGLDVLLDESTEPDVLKSGGLGIGVGRTVLPKLDNLIAEIAKEYAGQEMEGKGNAMVSLFPFLPGGRNEPNGSGTGRSAYRVEFW